MGGIIRCFVKKYNFNYTDIKKDINICLISDIHYNSSFNDNNLIKINDTIYNNNPDYVVIAGDIIDSLDIINDNKVANLYNWLNDLGSSIPVIIVFGNHDISKNKKLRNYSKRHYLFNKYVNDLNKLNVHLLDNSIYEDNYVRFVGFNLPINTYHACNASLLECNFYNSLDMNMFIAKKNKLNVCITHNPMNVCNDDVKNILGNFDLILTGHMHNGLVFSFIDRIFDSNWGIIDPDHKILPKVSRNMVSLDKDKYLIISGGITKLSPTSGIFKYGNFLFPMEVDRINVKKKIKK